MELKARQIEMDFTSVRDKRLSFTTLCRMVKVVKGSFAGARGWDDDTITIAIDDFLKDRRHYLKQKERKKKYV